MAYSLDTLRVLALVITCGPLVYLVYVLAAVPALAAPSWGERGRRRRAARVRGGLFARAESAVRKVAGWTARFENARLRRRLEELLRRSGYVAGMTPDELLASILLSGLAALLIGLLFGSLLEVQADLWLALLTAFGAGVPVLQLRSIVQERFKRVGRGLPPAIDLVALCMGAGSDFPSALRFVVRETIDSSDPVREEFIHILEQLEFGHTRALALKTFAERVPTEAVRDFVGAVVQAEEKGNPLAEVLAIQATMLRMRRSVAAEEAAARAGVMLIGPLMILLMAILLILFSPFIINGLGF